MKSAAAPPCRHFLADLHLSHNQPELTQAFLAYLQGPARQADEIYLLGDIFEYWLGDDVSMQDHAELISALAALPSRIRRYFLAGNRDFLLGQTMAQRCGFQILEQPHNLSGEPRLVVLHGDQLCTDDLAYQRYRKIVHRPWVQTLLLHLPQVWRRRLATRLRKQSQNRQRGAAALSISDANPDAVDKLLSLSGAEVMVHGHTHRPASHQHRHGRREVLPDWRPGQPQSFGWLAQDDKGFQRQVLGAA